MNMPVNQSPSQSVCQSVSQSLLRNVMSACTLTLPSQHSQSYLLIFFTRFSFSFLFVFIYLFLFFIFYLNFNRNFQFSTFFVDHWPDALLVLDKVLTACGVSGIGGSDRTGRTLLDIESKVNLSCLSAGKELIVRAASIHQDQQKNKKYKTSNS